MMKNRRLDQIMDRPIDRQSTIQVLIQTHSSANQSSGNMSTSNQRIKINFSWTGWSLELLLNLGSKNGLIEFQFPSIPFLNWLDLWPKSDLSSR